MRADGSIRFAVLLSAALMLSCFSVAQMKVGSFDGPVTKEETDSFLAFVSEMQPAASNAGNAWSYGISGQAIKGMGLVYQMTRDVRVLDQMIRFCDAELSERNDFAAPPTGKRLIWTGRIDPAWPNSLSQEPLSTGGEQGDPVGNLGNCAVMILKTPVLWNKSIPDGDPHRYGATYLNRAKLYVKQADIAVDGHILNGLLDLSREGHQYFSAPSPYKGGTPVPWNQQMMFNYAFQYLAEAHTLLKDDPTRATKYHKIVADNVGWFFNEGQQTVTDKQGNLAYNWGYALPSKGGEDCTHAGMDIAGFYLAYQMGDYPIDRTKMAQFANTFVDVVTLGPKSYAGRVDGTSDKGHAGATESVRSGYLLLAAFKPEAYQSLVSGALTEGGTTSNIELFTRFLWIKHLHAQNKTR